MSRLAFALALVFACVTGFATRVAALEIAGIDHFAAGLCRVTLIDGEVFQSVECKWGGTQEAPQRKIPDAAVVTRANGTPAPIAMDRQALEKWFSAVQKSARAYSVPPTLPDRKADKGSIRVCIGALNDFIWLTYPKSDPALWNQGVEIWNAARVASGSPDKLAAAIPLAVPAGVKPPPGLGPLTDFTDFSLRLTKVNQAKGDYGTLAIQWQRREEGRIEFKIAWSPRTGNDLEVKPDPKSIPAFHKALQAAIRGYRHDFKFASRKDAQGRAFERIDLDIMTGGRSGQTTLKYFAPDTSQWTVGQAMWNLARDQFPPSDREQIAP